MRRSSQLGGSRGERDVTIASADIIQQALNLGLVDEVCLSLVPVLFGGGVRCFGELVEDISSSKIASAALAPLQVLSAAASLRGRAGPVEPPATAWQWP